MLTYNDLGNESSKWWWERYDWLWGSYELLYHNKSKLLAQVPRWWEYFNWKLAYWAVAEYAPNLLAQVPRWWEKTHLEDWAHEYPEYTLVWYPYNWRELC